MSAFFDKVNAEDRTVVEGIYKGSRAPLSRSGPLSWLEREIQRYWRASSFRVEWVHHAAERQRLV
jgi:choline monooxygenase